jgi:hypothetical protein
MSHKNLKELFSVWLIFFKNRIFFWEITPKVKIWLMSVHFSHEVQLSGGLYLPINGCGCP